MTTAKIKDKQANPRAAHVLVNVARAQQHLAETLGDAAAAQDLLKSLCASALALVDFVAIDTAAASAYLDEKGWPEVRAKALLKAVSIGLKDPLQDDLNATHLREHRRGRPAKLATDNELAAFVTARFATHTFPALAAAVRTHFPKSRRISQSSIHRFWLKTKAQSPPQ
jgi:hypothetical protein